MTTSNSHEKQARVIAIVPAAGSGTRMKLGHNKAFLVLDGVPVLVRTLNVLMSNSEVIQIIVVTAEQELHEVHELLRVHFGETSRIKLVKGGSTRQESVKCGLLASQELVPGSFGKEGLVSGTSVESLTLVHDAARCLLTKKLLEECIHEAMKSGAATAAVPVIDSLVRCHNEEGCSEVDRTGLWAIQTPQVFRSELLLRAHGICSKESVETGVTGSTATDDASLVRRFHPVNLVEGERSNIKLTTPQDYQMALALLAAGTD